MISKPRKIFDLIWVFEPFEGKVDFFTKRMFGGMAVYVHGKMMMLLSESPGKRSWREQTFDFDIWDGVLIPTEREHHSSLQKEFPALVAHPILGKWLYLPQADSKFESMIQHIAEAISNNDPRFGIFPSDKTRKKKAKKA